MRGPTPLFIFMLFFLQLVVSWLAYRMMIRFGKMGRGWQAPLVYWILTAAALMIIYSGRLLRLPATFLQGQYYDWVSIAYAWTISQLVMVLIGAAGLTASWLNRKSQKQKTAAGAPGITRREFLGSAFAAAAPLAALGTGFGGVYQASQEMALNRYSIPVPGLPAEADGLKIAQLSDLHIGPFFSIGKLEQIIARLRQERPDMVVITGDFIDELELAKTAVERMSAYAPEVPQGIYFCWGNHEYFKDIGRLTGLLKQSAIHVLDNSSRQILGGSRPLYLAGVDYPWASNKAEQLDKRKRFLAEAVKNVPDDASLLLISHHPDFIEDAFQAGISLTLTGHTHGGQVAVFGKSLLPVQYRYMRGLYQQNSSYGYVHSGTGHWLPYRIGCPAEIAFFTLKDKGV